MLSQVNQIFSFFSLHILPFTVRGIHRHFVKVGLTHSVNAVGNFPTKGSLYLICLEKETHAIYKSYRAVKLSNPPLNGIPVCCQLICFLAAQSLKKAVTIAFKSTE